MQYVISTGPMYEDGSIGEGAEAVCDYAEDVGQFLVEQVARWIGSSESILTNSAVITSRCVALDVTIEVRE